MNWIELFKTGRHTDSAGVTRDFTRADLDRMVATLDLKRHEPPLVIGHPKTDAPAWGWVTALKSEDGVLSGAFRDVPDLIRTLVDKGRYKKRSIALYPDGRLRHVGLLGAAPPAVEGLRDIAAFAADECAFTEFSQDPPTEDSMDPKELEARVNALEAENALLKAKAEGADDAKIKELEARVAELAAGKEKAEAEKAEAEAAFAEARQKAARKDLEIKIDALVDGGKLLPRDKPAALAFAETLATGGELEFSEGQGKKPLQTHFFDFLAALPGHGLLGEFAAPSGRGGGASVDIPYADIMNKV